MSPGSREFRVHSPDSALRRPLQLLREMVGDLHGARELGWRLAMRDLAAQYRQAALGVAWAFLLPVANTLIWVALHAGGVLSQATPTEVPYAAYVFTGSILWSIFMDAAQSPLKQVDSAKVLLAKVSFPREALILAGLWHTLINAGIRVVVLLPVLLWMGAGPDAGLLLFPLMLVALVLAATVLGLLLVPVGILYTDVGKAMPLFLQLLMFLSPVVFVAPASGWLARVHEWNPLTPLVVNARHLLTGQAVEGLPELIAVVLASTCLLLAGWIAFRVAIPIVVERVGS